MLLSRPLSREARQRAATAAVRGLSIRTIRARTRGTERCQLFTGLLVSASAASCFAGGVAGATLLEAESSDQNKPFDIKDHYELTGQILGEGAFGKVYKATRKADGMHVAIKEIERSDDADQSEFEREISALTELSRDGGHPNICRLYTCHRTKDINYVVMEIIDGGEILEHLIQGGPYSEITASKFFRELSEGVAHIHSHNVIHADLKCENLMLSSWDDSNAVLKVVDFGTSVPTDVACKGLGGDIADFKGTAAYCSPERLSTGCPSKADDMWAVGAILFILLTGSHPFDPQGTMCDEDIEEIVLRISPDEAGMTRFHDIVFDQRVERLSDSSKALIQQLMHPDPTKRMTSGALLGNPWVQGLTASWSVLEDSDKKLKMYWQNNLRAAIFQKFAKDAEGKQVGLSDANLRQIFNTIDLDSSDTLSAQELRAALRMLGISDVECSMMIASADLDHSGCLDWEEFKTLMRQTFDEGPGVKVSTKKLFKTAMLTALSSDDAYGGEPTEKQILHMFQLIDQNGDGMLSVSELQLFFKTFNLTSGQIRGFIADAGGSGDDLDLEGFKLLCRAVFRGDARAS